MTNIKDYQLEIENLIADEQWAKAYELCNKLLSYDPENTNLIRLKKKIESAVDQINKKAIKQELNKLEPLLSEGNYETYLKNIAPLQTYVTKFPEIGKKILIAKKKLDLEYHQKREQAYHELLIDVKQRPETIDYPQLIAKLENFQKLDIHKNDVQKLIKKVKNDYIIFEIKKNAPLLHSTKFEDILLFLLNLKKIDHQNPTILRQISLTNNAYRQFRIENQQDMIFKTVEEIKTLYLRGKYDYCVELAERVLRIDDKNKIAIKYLINSRTKSSVDSENKIIESIFQYYHDFPSTKNFQQSNYIKI